MKDPLSKEAACNGRPTWKFFEDSWFQRKIPYNVGLAGAREDCDICPVRGACLEMEMEAEKGAAIDHRAGVFGGMTPQQRYSLERRGVEVFCSVCGKHRDPVKIRDGDLSCEHCGIEGEMEPVPDRGDDWTPRHTEMARTVIAWLVDNIEVDGEVPTNGRMARQLGLRVNDMRRVYAALEADQILENVEGAIVRRGLYASARGWVPRHLRLQV